MELLRTEGVILSTLDFKDYDLILTVFTSELGVAKFFFKKGKRKQHNCSPLTQVEIIYKHGKGDLLLCQELTVVHSHVKLRKDLTSLEVACDLIQSVKKTQLDSKPSPPLYQLLTKYLASVADSNSPQAIASSFRLKILRHDGLFGLLPKCAVCKRELEELYALDTEGYCAEHAPAGALRYSEEETKQLLLLSFGRKLSEFENLSLNSSFVEKVNDLFDQKYAIC